MQTSWIYISVVLPFLILISACGSDNAQAWFGVPIAEKPADSLPEGLLATMIAQGVPSAAATLAFEKFENFRPVISNPKYFSILDFTQHSSQPRLYVVNVETGHVDAMHAAHGLKSDPEDDGMANTFSNVPNSRKSSLGAYLVAEKYFGRHGASMRMDGLESSNNMARARAIVLHPATYVEEGKDKQGLSWGCPAVPYAWINTLVDRLRDGSFMYAYAPSPGPSMFEQMEIQRIMLDPAYQWVDEAEDAP